VLLVLVGAIADLPEPVNEYGARQAVAYLERAAIMYTLIQTAKLTDVDPQAWLADAISWIADTPPSRLRELLPWNWKTGRLSRAA